MIGVMNGLGHSVRYTRGEEIYSSPNIFERLMFVRSGIVAKALKDPVREEPLMLSLSCAGAMCGSFENLYVRDRLPRSHYCITNADVLVINQELLLKIADQNALWQRELMNYSTYCALCDRMGMVANRYGTIEERLGALMMLILIESTPSMERVLQSRGADWLGFTTFPMLVTVAQLLGTDVSTLHTAVRAWIDAGKLRKRSGKFWFHRATFEGYWSWLQNIVRQNA